MPRDKRKSDPHQDIWEPGALQQRQALHAKHPTFLSHLQPHHIQHQTPPTLADLHALHLFLDTLGRLFVVSAFIRVSSLLPMNHTPSPPPNSNRNQKVR